METGGQKYYYHYDALGSVVGLSGQSVEIAESYRYTPFGKVLDAGSLGNPYLYTGRRYDAETGLYYFRARFYHPDLRRFIEPDPIGYEDGMSLYAYVLNNPVMFVDPSGELVSAIYNKYYGIITVTDIDTGESASAYAESGGKPIGDPAPDGSYEILERAGNDNSYRIDAIDSTPRNDEFESAGRSRLRLHYGTRTTGCINCPHAEQWEKIKSIIDNTKVEIVTDKAIPWWKLWGEEEPIKKYGTLTVIERK